MSCTSSSLLSCHWRASRFSRRFLGRRSAASSSAWARGGKLEIFSWWTAGGEADGLAEMFKIYKQKYAGVEIVNATVAGGAGTNAKAVLKTRMEGGKPPDSFQVHAGQELISTWVKAGKMEPITSVWKSEGWDSTIPKDLKDIVSSSGDVWSVPVNVHRGNALWYNKKILDDNNITPPTDMEAFLSALGLQHHGRLGQGLFHRRQLGPEQGLRRRSLAGDDRQIRDRLRHLRAAEGRTQPRQRDQLDQGLRLDGGPGRLQSQEGIDPRADGRAGQHLRPDRPAVHRRVQDRRARSQLGARLGDPRCLRLWCQRRDGPVRDQQGRQQNGQQPAEALRRIPEVVLADR